MLRNSISLDYTELRERAASLEALVQYGTEDAHAALMAIGERDDPDAIRRRIALLIELGDISSAAMLADTSVPDSAWIDIGISALTLSGENILLRNKLTACGEIFKFDERVGKRIAVALGDSALRAHIQSSSHEQKYRSFFAIQPTNRGQLELAIAEADRFVGRIVQRSLSEELTPLDYEVLTVYAVVHALVGSGPIEEEVVGLLATQETLNAHVLHLVNDDRLPTVPALRDVARAVGEDDAERSVLLLSISAKDAKLRKESWNAIKDIFDRNTSASDRLFAYNALSLVAQELGKEDVESLLQYHAEVRECGGVEASLLVARDYLVLGRPREALIAIEPFESSTHPGVSEVMARAALQEGNEREALVHLSKVADETLGEAYLLEVAEIAARLKKWETVVYFMKLVVEYYPANELARRNYGVALLENGQPEAAGEYFEELAKQFPERHEYRLLGANAFRAVGNLSRAIHQVEEIPDGHRDELECALLLSDMYHKSGDPQKAYSILSGLLGKHGSEPRFLMHFISICYASGNDETAHEIFKKIKQLSDRGEVPSEHFRETTLDELVNFHSDSVKRQREFATNVCRGRLPWTLQSELSNTPVYMAHIARTQELRWLPERANDVGQFVLYATNSFILDATADDSRTRLVAIPPPTLTGAIVLDASAAVSLHRLGMLERGLSSFSKVYVNGEVFQRAFDDSARLRPHQSSRVDSMYAFHALVRDGKVGVASEEEAEQLPFLSEYSSKDGAIVFRSLLEKMRQAGLIDRKKFRRGVAIAHNEGGSTTELPELGSRVLIDAESMRVLISETLFEEVLNAYQIMVKQTDIENIQREIAMTEVQLKTAEQAEDLWASLRSMSTVEAVFPSNPLRQRSEMGGALLSVYIATEKGVPLYADDRVLQSIASQDAESPTTAFGTDRLLRALYECNDITMDELSEALVTMCKWRYRFLVIEADVLNYLAKQYDAESAGGKLRTVAKYVQGCVCDPGLFGGLERSDPPTSMALKFYTEWTKVASEFLVGLISSEFQDVHIKNIIGWASEELYPSIPPSIAINVREAVARSVSETALVMALMHAGKFEPSERSVLVMRYIGRALGFGDSEYQRIVLEVAEYADKY